LIQLCNQS